MSQQPTWLDVITKLLYYPDDRVFPIKKTKITKSVETIETDGIIQTIETYDKTSTVLTRNLLNVNEKGEGREFVCNSFKTDKPQNMVSSYIDDIKHRLDKKTNGMYRAFIKIERPDVDTGFGNIKADFVTLDDKDLLTLTPYSFAIEDVKRILKMNEPTEEDLKRVCKLGEPIVVDISHMTFGCSLNMALKLYDTEWHELDKIHDIVKTHFDPNYKYEPILFRKHELDFYEYK
jgi:hypothetical protein